MTLPKATIQSLDNYARLIEDSEEENYVDTGDLLRVAAALASHLTLFTGYMGNPANGRPMQ